jgi:glycosyl transferase family 25
MRAYVINLPSSADRRRRIEAQLRRAGQPYELIEAIDGRRLTASERHKLLDERQVAANPNWLTPGVIGCALSHWSVYQRVAEDEDEIALVLEDDASLPANVAQLSEDISQHMRGREIMLLYFRSHQTCRLSEWDAISVGRHRLLYPVDVHQPVTSTAYLVSRAAARSLVEAIVPLRAGPDNWGHYYELGVFDSLRCVFPRPVSVHVSLESTLGYGDRVPLRRQFKQQTMWPIPQLRALNRQRIARNMTRVTLVREASPISLRLTEAGS